MSSQWAEEGLNVHEEVVHDEGVLVEHDSANVSNGFGKDAHKEGTHIRPCLLADTIEELSGKQHKEAKHIDDVARNRRSVRDGGPINWAPIVQCAVLSLHTNERFIGGIEDEMIFVDAIPVGSGDD